MGSTEDAIKKYITSLLTSTPLSVTMQQLGKDYRNTIGEPIPYHKLGYNSLEHFLQSIPDTVRVKGTGPWAEVIQVNSEKSAHISNLVSQQKSGRPRVPRRKPWGCGNIVPPPPSRKRIVYYPKQSQTNKIHHPPLEGMKPPLEQTVTVPSNNLSVSLNHSSTTLSSNQISQPSTPSPLSNHTSEPASVLNASNSSTSFNGFCQSSITKPSLATAQPSTKSRRSYQAPQLSNDLQPPSNFSFKPVNLDSSTLKLSLSDDMPKLEDKVSEFIRNLISNNSNFIDEDVSSPLSIDTVKPEKHKNSLHALEKNALRKHHPREHRTRRTHGENKFKNKVESDSSEQCRDEDSVPFAVRSNMRVLISRYPQGIWCAEVPNVYRELFKREIKYQELGFRTLIELCTCLKSIFYCIRPSSEDFKLYDRTRPLPNSAEKKSAGASFHTVNNSMSNSESAGALPEIDWSDVINFLPPSTFKPGTEIPRAFVPDNTKPNDSLDIVLGEIYNLSKFWVYMDNGLLDELMNDLQVFYDAHAMEYQIPEHLLREGIYCVQIIFGEYHRAIIIDVLPDAGELITVMFIDYGTVSKVSKKGLCFLHERFSELPAQAIRCRLTNIRPIEENTPWSRAACAAFRRLVITKEITAKISGINWHDQYLEVYLADVTNNDIYYINDRLVEEGYAQYPDDTQKRSRVDSVYTPIVEYIHLFPTFLEVESGLAPSTAEMEIYYDCNVPINLIYPQYFSMDLSSELKYIEYVERFFEKKVGKGKRVQEDITQYFDKDPLHSESLDLSVFGELADEVRETLNIQKPNGFNENPTLADTYDTPITSIHKNIELLSELQKDCLLAQDIMRDLSIREIADGAESNDDLTNIDQDSLEDGDYYNEYSNENETMLNNYPGPDCEHCEDIVTNRSIGSGSTLENVEEGITYTTASENSFETQDSSDSVYEKSPQETNSDTGNVRVKHTNPFLSDYSDNEGSAPDEIFTLNPNNPFLTPSTKSTEGTDSDGSTASTEYGTYIEEVSVKQSWSLVDDGPTDMMSMFGTLSCSSSDSVQSEVTKYASSTQTVDGQFVPSQSYPNMYPYPNLAVPPPTYPPYNNWPMSGYTNYYLPNCSPYGYQRQPSIDPQLMHMHGYPQGPYIAGPQLPGIRPPPGFAPNSNIYERQCTVRVQSLAPTMYASANRAAIMPNTTYSGNSSSVSFDMDNRDFYERYNQSLQMQNEQHRYIE